MSEAPLSILQICFRMPYPLKDGGAIAMYNITKGFFENGCKLTLLVPVTSKHSTELSDLPADLKNMAKIHTVKIKTDITFWGALQNLFTKEPYYISRYMDHNFKDKLEQILRSSHFDIVQIESLKMVGYLKTIRENSSAKVVMRSHNIEFLIWKRMAEETNSIIKKTYLNILVKRIRKLEINTLNEFDAIVPITEVDGNFFSESGCKKPVIPAPTGFDLTTLKPDSSNIEPNSIFHIGALDWMPNLEALRWFMNNSWPIIHSRYPEVKFYIAGRNMPDEIKKYKSESVIICGEVESSIDFMNSKQIMVVPLLSGSGMRIKIVEGLALGKLIISTTVGAEGIGCKNLTHIMIADTPMEFAEILGTLISDKNFAEKLSSNAMTFVQEHFDNNLICKRLLNKYRELLV